MLKKKFNKYVPTFVKPYFRKIRCLLLTTISRSISPWKIRRLIKNNNRIKVHLGCGVRILDGWVNTDNSINKAADIVYVNLLKKLPFPDNIASCVFSEHVHEHLSYNDGVKLLSEIHRVLVPSGTLRIAVPDLDFYINLLSNRQEYTDIIREYHQKLMPSDSPYGPVAIINCVFLEHSHQYIYDFQELKRQLEAAGFNKICKKEAGQSDTDDLRKLETDPLMRGETLDLHLAYTLCVEAVK